MNFVQCFRCGLSLPRSICWPVQVKDKRIHNTFVCSTCKDILDAQQQQKNEPPQQENYI